MRTPIENAQTVFAMIDLLISGKFDTDPGEDKKEYELVLSRDLETLLLRLEPNPNIVINKELVSIDGNPWIESIMGVKVINTNVDRCSRILLRWRPGVQQNIDRIKRLITDL